MTGPRRKLPPYPALIERLRRDLSITQTALAERLKVSAMSVSRWERGVQEPSSQIFVKLGALSNGETRWIFWEYAGLKRSHLEEAAPGQIAIPANESVQKIASIRPLVSFPLLSAQLGASLFGDFLSESEPVDVLTSPAEWCPNPSKTVGAFVDGDSMEPLIRDGSIVCIDTSEHDPESLCSHVVVASHPSMGTKVAWLERNDEGFYFRSENPKAESMPLTNEWKLTGKVLWWMTRANYNKP